MSEYIKLFDTTTEYNTYFNSVDFKSPNVSLCKDNSNIYYNPKRYYVTATYTKQPNVKLINNPNLVTKMWIDGVLQSKVVSECTFSDSGICTVKYVLTSIGDQAFNDCSGLTSITIPEGVTSIGSLAFRNCSGLTSITIPNGVMSIGNYAFNGCSGLTSITIPNSVRSIGREVFKGCSALTSITIGNSVTRIGDGAFNGCFALTSITILEGVTSIGLFAFTGCSGLTSITIPSSVTNIERSAFNGCSSLTNVYCEPTTPPTLGADVFKNNAEGHKIYVPAASVDAYKAAENWSTYATDIEAMPR